MGRRTTAGVMVMIVSIGRAVRLGRLDARRTCRWLGSTVALLGLFVVAFAGSAAARATASGRAAEPQFAYVANNTRSSVSVVNLATNTVVVPNITVGPQPRGVAISPDGRHVYVAFGTSGGQGSVAVIDTATNSVTATIPSVGITPTAVAVSPDGRQVYVTNFASGANGTVAVIDTATNAVTARIPIGGSGFDVEFTPDGRRAYVANATGNSVAVIDTATNTVITTIPAVGTTPAGIAFTPDGSRAYLSNNGSNNVRVIDTATNTLTATNITGLNQPRRAVVTPDGSRVYIANFGGSTVRVINTATNTMIATLTGFSGPEFLAITPDGARVYVSNGAGSTLSMINTATNAVTAPATPTNALASPAGIAIEPPPHLAVTKHASPNPVHVGGVESYTITVHNRGVDVFTGVVTDDLSGVLDNADYGHDAVVSPRGRGKVKFHSATEELTWHGSLRPGATVKIRYSVRVRPLARLRGSRMLSNGVVGPEGLSFCTDPHQSPELPCRTETPIDETPGPGPNLKLTKTASPEHVVPGELVSYRLVVTNLGEGHASGVRLEDPIPSGLVFVRAKPSRGRCRIRDELLCRLGPLNAGRRTVVKLTARVDLNATGEITNKATVWDNAPDPQQSNDTDSTTTHVIPPPTIDIITPVDGGTYTLDEDVPSNFTCTEATHSPPITSCLGNGHESGTPIDTSTLGSHTFTVVAKTDGLTSTHSVTYEVTLSRVPPTASIATPANGATYAQGQVVDSSFTCTAAKGTVITSCVDQDGRPSGTPIDTTPGTHTFTVTATANNGETGRDSVTYRVPLPAGAPTASITTPANGATYAQGQVVDSSFTCTAAAGTVIVSCLDQNGHPSGTQVDTTTPGTHPFKVTATANNGETGSDSVTYTVQAATAGCPDPAAAYNQGFNTGFNAGFNPGFNSGWRSGFNAGFNAGYHRGFGRAGDTSQLPAHAVASHALFPACNSEFNQGYNAGFNAGFNPGFNSGWRSGFNAGFNPGFNAGFRDRRR